MFHLKLDLSISLLYFWLLRRKPTAVTVDHFGLCLTFCRQAKPFGVTLNHFTFRWVDWCDTIPLRLTINHLPITWAISHHSEPFVSSHSTKVQLAEPFVISALNHFSKHLANFFFLISSIRIAAQFLNCINYWYWRFYFTKGDLSIYILNKSLEIR